MKKSAVNCFNNINTRKRRTEKKYMELLTSKTYNDEQSLYMQTISTRIFTDVSKIYSREHIY